MKLLVNLFPKQQILDSSNLKKFAEDIFKFSENCRKFSKRIENSVGKGETAHYQQFLHFLKCFKRLARQTCKNQGLFGKGLKLLILPFKNFLKTSSKLGVMCKR